MSEYQLVVPAWCTRLANEQTQAEVVYVTLQLLPETDSVEGLVAACLETDCSHYLEEAAEAERTEPAVRLFNDQLDLLGKLDKWGPTSLQLYLDWSDPVVNITPLI